MEWTETKQKIEAVKENMEKVMVGKTKTIEFVLAAVLAQGHVLLEDVPGTGKTMLAKSLAQSLGTGFKRIQFTPDLLPSDLIGINYYNQKEGEFTFRPGALFTNVLLADEINRATPRTQSSLLESMEEKQITVDGHTYPLERPFFVIATQNPIETQGTFPLPEAQLDRFLMQLSIGYTDKEDTLKILERFLNDSPIERLRPVCTQDELVQMQDSVKQVYVHPDVAGYSADIVMKTRNHEEISLGVSPRGNLALLRCAQALALIRGRQYVTPEDIRELAIPVLGHRIILRGSLRSRSAQIPMIVESILEQVEVPTEDWTKAGKQ
jgi:MoxR-like ATPase